MQRKGIVKNVKWRRSRDANPYQIKIISKLNQTKPHTKLCLSPLKNPQIFSQSREAPLERYGEKHETRGNWGGGVLTSPPRDHTRACPRDSARTWRRQRRSGAAGSSGRWTWGLRRGHGEARGLGVVEGSGHRESPLTLPAVPRPRGAAEGRGPLGFADRQVGEGGVHESDKILMEKV